jgi:hypothetical protein
MDWLEFWEHEFGNVEYAQDFAGRMVRKGDYRKQNSEYAWDYDHILPESPNGPNSLENWQIVNIKTNREKADKTSFKIDGVLYQVQKNTQKNTQGKQLAPYPNKYKGKKYCIIIVQE